MTPGLSRRRAVAVLGAAPFVAIATNAARAQQVTVRVGTPKVSSDAPLYIAVEKGFFAKQGIAVQFVGFASAADMVVPLGTGQLDVGAGGLSAGLFNAVQRGVAIKAVADKVTLRPGSHYLDLVIADRVLAAGRFTSLKDLRGLRVAEAGTKTSTSYALSVAAKDGGLDYDAFAHPSLSFPSQLPALQNGSVDAAVCAEPLLTRIIESGVGSLRNNLDRIVPNLQVAVLLYSEAFARKGELAQRFMDAYIEAARYYMGAVRDNRLQGPNAADVIAILTRYTALKNPAVYRKISPSEIDPDGRMNVPCLRDMLAFFRAQGYVHGKVSVEDLLDTRFVTESVRRLGPA